MNASSEKAEPGPPGWWSAPTAHRAAHSTQSTPTPNSTANASRQPTLPEASSWGGRRGGAAGREEERGHPADASRDSPTAPLPWTPDRPKLPGPRLGQGGYLQSPHGFRTPPHLQGLTGTSPHPTLLGLTWESHSPERPARCTSPEAPQDPGAPAGRGREGALRGRSQGHPATTY